MIREIKFRGKRLNDGEWSYGFYVISSGHGLIHEGDSGHGIWTVIPETVGQFTGLKDYGLDGKRQEIFEGDKVKATNRHGWTREFEIIWNEDQARFMVREADQPIISFNLTNENIIDFHVLVIGNVHNSVLQHE